MTIASEISRLQCAKADICTAIENKGVTVGNIKLDCYAPCIDAIQSGGGGLEVLVVGHGGNGYCRGGGGGGGVMYKVGVEVDSILDVIVGGEGDRTCFGDCLYATAGCNGCMKNGLPIEEDLGKSGYGCDLIDNIERPAHIAGVTQCQIGGGGAGAMGDGMTGQGDCYHAGGNGGPGFVSDIEGNINYYGWGGGGCSSGTNYLANVSSKGGCGGGNGGTAGCSILTYVEGDAYCCGGGGGSAKCLYNCFDGFGCGAGGLAVVRYKDGGKEYEGGQKYCCNGYVIHKFKVSGQFGPKNCCIPVCFLVVGGGGGGAGGNYCGPGGGGGGGSVVEGTCFLTNNDVIHITVGEGGQGGCRYVNTIYIDTTNGGNSSFGNLCVCGGGAGGFFRYCGAVGGNGGGGMGYSGADYPGGRGRDYGFLGYRGGCGYSYGGGGGGAGGRGGDRDTVNKKGGDGGIGCLSSISGESCYYGGGGGGGSTTNANYTGGCGGLGGGGNGIDSRLLGDCNATYYGGGGGGGICGNCCMGGNGYCGIVIVSYNSGCGYTITGGDCCYECNGKCVHIFTQDGYLATCGMQGWAIVDYILIGGGGGGGMGRNNVCYGGGGGGAGGVVICCGEPIHGENCIVIGRGGLGTDVICTSGTNGGDSCFLNVVALGGGGGGGTLQPGNDGGSGGGGGSYTNCTCCSACTPGGVATEKRYTYQGCNGGKGGSYGAAGGGGAGGNGVNGAANQCTQLGGNGIENDFSGEMCWYAGGGSGGGSNITTCVSCGGTLAQNNATICGAGGGGARCVASGNGGDGLLILRYPANCGYNVTGGTKYECNGYCIHIFTSDGTLTVN